MKEIQTLLEAIKPENLGITDAHNHLIRIGGPQVAKDRNFLLDSVENAYQDNLTFSLPERNKKREPGYHWPDSAATIYGGDLDHQYIINILKSSGHDGDLSIEDGSLNKFPEEERLKIIEKDIDFVKSLL